VLDVPEARASVIWMLSEWGREEAACPRLLPDALRLLAAGFRDEVRIRVPRTDLVSSTTRKMACRMRIWSLTGLILCGPSLRAQPALAVIGARWCR
jgi:hypothetical protein